MVAMTTPRRPDPGIDTPTTFVRLLGSAVVCALSSLFLAAGGLLVLAIALLVVASCLGLAAYAWARSGALAKPAVWAELAATLPPATTIRSLDLGCGRGVALFAVAEWTGGDAVGIDRWIAAQQSGNHQRVTAANIGLLNLDDRVRLATADVAALPLDAAQFDVVTASLVLISLDEPVRQRVLEECERVLRPGGLLLVVEARRPRNVQDSLRAGGWTVEPLSANLSRQPWPRLFALRARRPVDP